MKRQTFLSLLALAVLLVTGCKGEPKNEVTPAPEEETTASTPAKESTAPGITGTYATESYARRAEGYDWIGVRVRDAGDGQLWISVRSRSDKKRPTCTFDGRVYPVGENTYETVLEGQTAVFAFTGETLEIRPKTGADAQALSFRCSGGGSLAGTYHRIEGNLDPQQVDPTTFMKYLTLQGISFNVSARQKEGNQEVTIRSMGLEISDTDPINMEVPGEILDAAIGDLNADGYPEVVVFSRDGNRAGVHGVSVNGGKSMSMFYFPPLENNAEASEGYTGGDTFKLIETALVQEFPIAGGKTRQVTYELVNGENSRVFRIRNVSEY